MATDQNSIQDDILGVLERVRTQHANDPQTPQIVVNLENAAMRSAFLQGTSEDTHTNVNTQLQQGGQSQQQQQTPPQPPPAGDPQPATGAGSGQPVPGQ